MGNKGSNNVKTYRRVASVTMTVLIQLSVAIGCQQQAEVPSVPSPQQEPAPIPSPASVPKLVIPPSSPVSPNPSGYLNTSNLAQANTEVANVEAAAAAYYAVNGNWPRNANGDLVNGGFLSEPAVYDYSFNSSSRVVVPDGAVWPNDSSIFWSATEHKWHR